MTLEAWAVPNMPKPPRRRRLLHFGAEEGGIGLSVHAGAKEWAEAVLENPEVSWSANAAGATEWPFEYYVDSSWMLSHETKIACTNGHWAHIALVFDGHRLLLCLDGKSALLRNVSGEHITIPKSTKYCIGASGHATLDDGWTGIIDEVRISSIARYTDDFTPQRRFEPDEHTMALYHFDEGTGDVLHDSSGNGHHGKIVGAKWVKVDEGVNAVAEDLDRRVAEWVLSVGGHLQVDVDGRSLTVRRTEDLPIRPYKIRFICDSYAAPKVLEGKPDITHEELRRSWFEDLARIESLEYLRLNSLGVTKQELRRLENPSLFDLAISQAKIDDDDLLYIATKWPKLGRLNVGRSQITNEGLRHLRHLGHLEHLCVNDTRVTDEGVQCLTDLKGLKVLALVGTEVSDEGIQHLEALKELTQLRLFGTKVTQAGVAELQAALPECEITLDSEATPDDTTTTAPTKPPPLAVAPFTPDEAKQHQQAWADHLGLPVEFENSIGMKMVLIPPGEFMMGSSEEEIAWLLQKKEAGEGLHASWRMNVQSEYPRHRVQITQPFYMGRCEVTVGEFRAFADATGYGKTEPLASDHGASPTPPAPTWKNPGFEQTDRHPVVLVNWSDAETFRVWLSGEEDRTYRLPTEAQREYACRGGSDTRWHFGDDPSTLDLYGWCGAVGEATRTYAVGEKFPNAFGLFDMHGNVAEWCADWFSAYDPGESLLSDPAGTTFAKGRVRRDSAVNFTEWATRCARRTWMRPTRRTTESGFRVILLIDPDNPPKPSPQPPANPPEPMTTEPEDGEETPKISWKLRHTLTGHTDEVSSVAFHPKGVMVASGSKDGTIRFWSVEPGRHLRMLRKAGGLVTRIAISPDGKLVAAVGDYGDHEASVTGPPGLWDVATGESLGNVRLPRQHRNVSAVAFSPDSSVLAWGMGVKVAVCSLSTGEIRTLQQRANAYTTTFSQNGDLLACGLKDGSTQIWNAATGRETLRLPKNGEQAPLHSVVFSPDGTLLATQSAKGVDLWDVRNGDLHKTIPGDGTVHSIAFHPGGSTLFIGRGKGIDCRDLASSDTVAKLVGHDQYVESLAFSPDGKLLVSGSRDKTVRIWEIAIVE